MTTNPGMDGITSLFSNKLLRDLVTEQAIKGLRNGGVRLGESATDKLKGLDATDVMGIAEQFFGGLAQATSPKEPVKSETPAPPAPRPEEKAPKPEPAPKPADVSKPAEDVTDSAPVEEVKVEISVKEPVTAEDQRKVAEALAVLETVFTSLTPATRDTAIASVMRLVESASGNGLTGEHAAWIARLYGNRQLS